MKKLTKDQFEKIMNDINEDVIKTTYPLTTVAKDMEVQVCVDIIIKKELYNQLREYKMENFDYKKEIEEETIYWSGGVDVFRENSYETPYMYCHVNVDTLKLTYVDFKFGHGFTNDCCDYGGFRPTPSDELKDDESWKIKIEIAKSRFTEKKKVNIRRRKK